MVARGAGLIERLRLSKRFLAILRRGTWAREGALSVGILQNDLAMNRVGLRIRKSVGNAVARNRTKRLLREACRVTGPSLRSGHDILVVVSRAHAASLPKLQLALQRAFSKTGLLRDRPSRGS